MSNTSCLFCEYTNPAKNSIIAETALAYARWDNFPVSEGHAEIVPKRHFEPYFDLTEDELLSIHELAKETKQVVDTRYHPNAYNIGINDGEAAGRSVHHLHIHLIPRYKGDVDNPRGGVRHIIPGKGDY